MRGRLEVVETPKGPPARFTRCQFNAGCSDLRMDVGDYAKLGKWRPAFPNH